MNTIKKVAVIALVALLLLVTARSVISKVDNNNERAVGMELEADESSITSDSTTSDSVSSERTNTKSRLEDKAGIPVGKALILGVIVGSLGVMLMKK